MRFVGSDGLSFEAVVEDEEEDRLEKNSFYKYI